MKYVLAQRTRSELEYCWSECFEHSYGCFRDEVKEAFDDFLDCGILLHGCARAVCEECHHSELIPFSCKRRFVCSSCDAKPFDKLRIFNEHCSLGSTCMRTSFCPSRMCTRCLAFQKYCVHVLNLIALCCTCCFMLHGTPGRN